MKERDVIKTLDDLPLHAINCCCAPCHMEMELGCSPVLFNKIEFTVVFWVKIAQMAIRLDQLLKLGFLGHKIWLQEENASAAAVGAARGTVKTQALGEKVSFGPQTLLPNDDLHALESAGHGGVVFGEIEQMQLSIWECATAHVWTVRVVHQEKIFLP